MKTDIGHRPSDLSPSHSVERGNCSGRAGKPLTDSDTDSDVDIDAVFDYRVAELSGANVTEACMGFAVQWLGMLRNRRNADPSTRMETLNFSLASTIQAQYQDSARIEDGNREQREAARADARRRLLIDQRLTPIGPAQQFNQDGKLEALSQIARGNQTNLITLCFESDRKRVRHAIAASASAGNIAIFDPNYGEFSASTSQLPSFFEDLMARYGSRLNGRLKLESMVVQKVQP